MDNLNNIYKLRSNGRWSKQEIVNEFRSVLPDFAHTELNKNLDPENVIMIRLFDVVLSAMAILMFSPILFPIIVLLKFTGEGEIFYRQERIGRNQKPFQLLKFPTMLKDAPNMAGGTITVADDPRILPMGHF